MKSFGRARLIVIFLVAAASFHAAYNLPRGGCLMIVFCVALLELLKLPSARLTFYTTLLLGYAIYAPQLSFFWTLFQAAAIVLWLVLAFWLAIFAMTARALSERFPKWSWISIPLVWCGIEYFRSECYYLKFSWLNIADAFSGHAVGLNVLGSYGLGFFIVLISALLHQTSPRRKLVIPCVASFLLVAYLLPLQSWGTHRPGAQIRIAGLQMEFPGQPELMTGLAKILTEAPEADLIVLSEYTFTDPIPAQVFEWCRINRRYLIAGAKEPMGSNQFYNVANVIGPEGKIVFQQAKSVPIQFFADGLPAKSQSVWKSPWGSIGLCICYDLSYRRVVDELIRQGAQAIIVPTMDVAEWGYRQHLLHSRIGPMRAAEFNVPIVRICSSGISQIIDDTGYVRSTGPFPGENFLITGTIYLNPNASLPWDHWFAPGCLVGTILLLLLLLKNLTSDSPNRSPARLADDNSRR